jgi:hypothetical protein
MKKNKLTKKQKTIQSQRDGKKLLRNELSIMLINKIAEDVYMLEKDSELLDIDNNEIVNNSLRNIGEYLIKQDEIKRNKK